MTYTREQLEHIRKELKFNGGRSKKKMADYLDSKKKALSLMKNLTSAKNYKVNEISSIKDILGKM
jgi:hypothetical protein